MFANDPTSEQIGSWISTGVWCVTGGLGAVWLARQLWVSFSAPTPQEYVTRKEYESRHEDLARRIDDTSAAIQDKLDLMVRLIKGG